ncbi:MAG: DNA repair protein RecN [Candidatus Kapabacteria bacterium]|nr:DNA repair protein RecN [Candidatus Kapabacteria bacterium]
MVLRRLTIRSFTLIDEIDLDFDAGMTVLLGETGAGKSIIIDALAAAMGERVSPELVRQGARKAVIEATFDISARPTAAAFIAEHALGWDAPEVVLRREIPASGASRCFINDSPMQSTQVRQLASLLIDVHGQHDTHGLMSPTTHLEAYDAFALHDGGALRASMLEHWQRLSSLRRRIDDLRRRAVDADADRARLRFIHDEIAAINPTPGEDSDIALELRRIEAGEHVVTLAESVRDRLYSGDPSAYDLIRGAIDSVAQLREFDPQMEGIASDLESALIICKEAAASAALLADIDDRDPQRLEDMRLRHVSLQRLIRKYGSLESAVERLESVARELHDVEHLDEVLSEAEQHLSQALAQAQEVADGLSQQRRSSAQSFESSINSSLHEMGMPAAMVRIDIRSCEVGPTGADHVEFLFAANSGEPLRPLAKIASGGELSRVMLALKRALFEKIPAGTVVLDEIDTGISGRVARTVGLVMQQLARRQQLICITHLAQIASLADNFMRVTKSSARDRTTITAVRIDKIEAQHDVAMLLSGSDVTETALSGARELMQQPAKKTARKAG